MLCYNRLENIKWMIWKQQVYYKNLYRFSQRGPGKLSQHPWCNKPSSALLQLFSGIFWFQSVDYIHKQSEVYTSIIFK